MDRPFQGIGWLPQIGNAWLRDKPDQNREAGRDAGRGDNGDLGEPVRTARREQRSEAVLTFAVCGLTVSGRLFVELSSTVNVSHSGCCLWLRTCPQANSALALREVPGGASLPKGASQVLFQVAWLQAQAGGWLVGAFALGQADLLAGEGSGEAAGRCWPQGLRLR